jgi:dethiobiotin synthetase
MTPTVIIVGADKGGVGKTTVSRALLDYLSSNGIEHRAFDTEIPTGALTRFFPTKTTVVDLESSDDQMKVFDTLNASQVTVIDVRAGLLSPILKTLSDIGFLEAAKQSKLNIIVLHVLGPATQSLQEIAPTIAALQGSRHIAVANHVNDTAFEAPADAINIPKLDERACDAVDKAGTSFNDYITVSNSMVLRGHVKHWLGQVYDEFNRAKLNMV